MGNPDKQAVRDAMKRIVDRVMRQKRKSETSLYREYQQSEDFKQNFINVIERMLGNLEHVA